MCTALSREALCVLYCLENASLDSAVHKLHHGQIRRVVTQQTIAAVEASVKENSRVTLNEIAAHLDMSHGS